MIFPLFIINVSVVIFNKENKILIAKRSMSEVNHPGVWGIPGGTVEINDSSLENALKREVEEEVGIEIQNIQILKNEISDKGDKGKVYVFYKAEYLSGIPEPKDGTDEVKWMDWEEIKDLQFTPKAKEIIKGLLA